MPKAFLVVIVFLLMGSGAYAFGECLMGCDAVLNPSVATNLCLTEDQTAVIKSLHEAFEEEFRPLQNQLLGKRGELAQLWTATDPDQERIVAKELEIREIRSRIQGISTSYQLKCRQILSPEQRKNLSTFSNQYRGSRRGRAWANYGW